MPRVRDDFQGVIYVHTPRGSVKLSAGDEVPKGAKIEKEYTVASNAPKNKQPATTNTEGTTDDTSTGDDTAD